MRARFEQRFTARRMAEDYVRIYAKLIEEIAVEGPNQGAASLGPPKMPVQGDIATA